MVELALGAFPTCLTCPSLVPLNTFTWDSVRRRLLCHISMFDVANASFCHGQLKLCHYLQPATGVIQTLLEHIVQAAMVAMSWGCRCLPNAVMRISSPLDSCLSPHGGGVISQMLTGALLGTLESQRKAGCVGPCLRLVHPYSAGAAPAQPARQHAMGGNAPAHSMS